MALKATPSLTDTARVEGQFGPVSQKNGTLAFDSSYPTNGEAVLASQIGLSTINQLDILPMNGYVFQYVAATAKIKVYYADYDANADGALIEVANTTDLSALTAVPYRAFGTEA